MKKKIILVLFFQISLVTGFSQVIVTTAGNINASAGTVTIPIQVTNCNNISAISLVLEYETSSLTYLGYQSLNVNLSTGFFFLNESNGKIITSWISSSPINIGNGTLYELNFQSSGSSGYLNWDTQTSGNCEYSDPNGNIISGVFINGGVNLSQGSFQLSLKAFLEGPFSVSTMSNALNISEFIPLNQPYNISPWNYDGAESVIAIPNNNIVDWVLIELRETMGDALTATSDKRIARQAGFLLKNGFIVGIDGINNIEFTQNITQNLYAIIWHRNHLAIMNAIPLTISGNIYNYDFTISSTQSYGGMNAVKQLNTGVWGMHAGDANGNGIIVMDDIGYLWKEQAGKSGYLESDFNMNGQVENSDKNELFHSNYLNESQVP